MGAIWVGGGAAVGAVLRWQLGMRFNGGQGVPWGTLLANLIGALLIGMLLVQAPRWPLEWRLLLITGFLGGLTTFSSFSAETVQFMQQGRYGAVLAMLGLHVGGSLLMTLLGVWVMLACLGGNGVR